MKNIDPAFVESVRGNQKVRQRLAYEDPLWFCLLYLHEHFTAALAPFHQEVFHVMREPRGRWTAVMAFRESGKSTLLNLGYALWSILGAPQKRFVLIMSKTSLQATSHFVNIKDELGRNALLREDFGPFTDRESEWSRSSLELVYHEAKIMSVTFDQSVRGLKHGRNRPDLIICDDIEDASDAGADKTRDILERFDQEIFPAGTDETHIVVLGNLLGEESLMVRLEERIVAGEMAGVFRAYPLLDEQGKCLWPSKFDRRVINRLRKSISGKTWGREYLLDPDSANYQEPSQRLKELLHKRLPEGFTMPDIPKVEGPTQAPLISQMGKFKIMTPHNRKVREEDPKYKNRIQTLANLLNHAMGGCHKPIDTSDILID